MTRGNLLLRPLREEDWDQVSEIYRQGIATGNATFETLVPDWNQWNNVHLKECRIVAGVDNTIAGWAALSPVSSRCVYGGVAEVSVYIHNDFKGKKTGTILLEELIKESELNEIWTLQAGIFPENKVSIHMHEKAGFRVVGYREKIGQMHGMWRDTVLMERRSDKIGVE